MPGHFGCPPQGGSQRRNIGPRKFFLEKKSPAKSEASQGGPPFMPEDRPWRSQCWEPSPRGIRSRPHFLGEPMSRPHRAEGWSRKAFNMVLPTPSEAESPRAPRMVTVRERVRLTPRSASTLPPAAAGGSACLWGMEQGRGQPRRCSGPPRHSPLLLLTDRAGRLRVSLQDPPPPP